MSLHYRYSGANLRPNPHSFADTSRYCACVTIQNYVYYGEEIWVEDEEIYNPKARKTEIKIGAK